METVVIKFGQLYLLWEDKDGNVWEAPKDQVEFWGKECFEQDLEDMDESTMCYQITEEDIHNESVMKWSDLYEL